MKYFFPKAHLPPSKVIFLLLNIIYLLFYLYFKEKIIMINLTITDFNKKEAEIIKAFSAAVANEMNRLLSKPIAEVTDGFCDRSKPFPKDFVNVVSEKMKELNPENKSIVSGFRQQATLLVYEAQQHMNDNWDDLYTLRISMPFGTKNVMYKNEHPTADMLNQIRDHFTEDYLEMLEDKEGSEEKVQSLIAMEAADHCLGEDFKLLFNGRFEELPENMQTAFMEDAENILTELKQTVQQ